MESFNSQAPHSGLPSARPRTRSVGRPPMYVIHPSDFSVINQRILRLQSEDTTIREKYLLMGAESRSPSF
jgi:hypothetical protein